MTTRVVPVGYKWGESYLMQISGDIDNETSRRILDRAVQIFNDEHPGITWVPHTSELLFEDTDDNEDQDPEYDDDAVTEDLNDLNNMSNLEHDDLESDRASACERAFNEITETGPRPVGNTRGPRPSRKQKMPLTTNVIEGMSIEDLDAKLAVLREKGIAFLEKIKGGETGK